jgi:hypothetical protein
MEEIRALCACCIQEYIEAGYLVRRNWGNQTAESCDKCRERSGFEYFISDPRENDAKQEPAFLQPSRV